MPSSRGPLHVRLLQLQAHRCLLAKQVSRMLLETASTLLPVPTEQQEFSSRTHRRKPPCRSTLNHNCRRILPLLSPDTALCIGISLVISKERIAHHDSHFAKPQVHFP